jgi:hypothetical protein
MYNVRLPGLLLGWRKAIAAVMSAIEVMLNRKPRTRDAADCSQASGATGRALSIKWVASMLAMAAFDPLR